MKKLLLIAALFGSMAAYATAPQRRVPGDTTHISMNGPRRAPIHRAAMDVGVQKLIPRIPVIMVEFTDMQFTRTKAQVDSLFNAVNYTEQFPQTKATGSIRQYFKDQSMGLYDPQFDIFGPVQVNRSCCDGFGSNSSVGPLAKQACQLADEEIDFSQYDADNDGQIDLVYIFYAGFGQNDKDYIANGLVSNINQLIWPHWSITGGASYDGKLIRDYECANELDGYWTRSMSQVYPAGIGVAVHEFCHALGIPDLYCTVGDTYAFKHLGMYDIMDYGLYNDEMFCPPSLSAYERWFLGWLTPTLLNTSQNVDLGYIGETNEAYLITQDGQPLSGPHATTQSYYLLENRQKRKWDKALPGHGMMITRITYDASIWANNHVNNNSSLQRVQVISADGDYSLTGSNWYGKATDLFPAGASSYTSISNYPIYNITEDTNGVIHFQFMDTTTRLDNDCTMDNVAKKVMHQGQVVIIRNGRMYNMMGQAIQ